MIEPAKTTTTQPQAQLSGSLFGNLNAVKPAPAEEKKPATEQKPGMFSGLSSFQNLSGNKDQQAQPSTTQPSASANSFASIFANAPQEKPAPPSMPAPKKDEQQTNPAPSSSGLFGPASTGPQAPAQSGSGGIGGNWLNQIKSEPKANEGGSIFARLGAQPGSGTTQPPAANSLFAT